MSGSTRICPKCKNTFSATHAVCPEDSAKLLIVTREPESRVGEVIGDKLTLLGLLGRGGMGSVYRALQHSMQREVAVKLLKRSVADDIVSVKRFLHEATTASKLNHPNLITLFDYGQTEDGELYFMMELLEGRTLSRVLKMEAPLEPKRVVDMMVQACDGLHYAHQHGLIHRDFKPGNIFLIQSGREKEFIKVLDFGIAKVAGADSSEELTRTGVLCGTPGYVSPEQVMGEAVDRRSDVYSVGIVMYELLTGRRPFVDDTPMKVLLAHMNDQPLPLREARQGLQVPVALERLVMRTLAKMPEHRPSSAADLATLLIGAMEQHEERPITIEMGPIDTNQGVDAAHVVASDPTISALEGSVDPDLGGLIQMDTDARTEAPPSIKEPVTGDPPVAVDAARRRSVRLLALAAGASAVAIGAWALLGAPKGPDRAAEPGAAGLAPGAAAVVGAPSAVTEPEPGAAAAPAVAEPAAKPATVVPAAEPPALRPQGIPVVTHPAGATVHVDGVEVGKTPINVPKSRGGKAMEIKIKRAGYEGIAETVAPGYTGRLVYKLRKTQKARSTSGSKRSKPRRKGPGIIE